MPRPTCPRMLRKEIWCHPLRARNFRVLESSVKKAKKKCNTCYGRGLYIHRKRNAETGYMIKQGVFLLLRRREKKTNGSKKNHT